MFKIAKLMAPFAAMTILAACGSGTEPSERGAAPMIGGTSIYATDEGQDRHSYAQPLEARVIHVSLDLNADFDEQRMVGTATLDLDVAEDGEEVVLDSKGLEIREVVNGSGEALRWEMGADSGDVHGAPLTIALDGAEQVTITYASAPGASALQWLSPEQTAGGEDPFLFSQGQAILNRTWIPTQDSPGIRQSWDARITVPEGLRAVMSAEMLTPEGEPVDGEPGRRAYRFRMADPVAPYLIAIAIGDLAFQELGERSGVYAEPSMLSAAASEFEDLEEMIAAAEELYGEYRWGRYDLLVLPPSFPFGGMENPRLTFVTPTILAGDKSLVSLIAHELAHSWSGNLVTNASWDDFWLNEGFTVYFENRIMEAVYGTEQAAMLADLGWADMMADVEDLGGLTSPDTRLHLDLEGRDPDDGMTNIAYEKGAVFLRTVEETVGRARFDAWLRDYFDRNAFRPQTSAGLIADMDANLFQGEEAAQIGLDQWIYEPGLPENAVHVQSNRFRAVDQAIANFTDSGEVAVINWPEWTTQERLRFLDGLPRELDEERLEALESTFDLNDARNSEIRFAWLKLAIANRYDDARDSVEDFLLGMGRRKFVAPLFEALMAEGDWGRPFARRIYGEARPRYHSVTTNTVDETVGMSDG
ncbi:M1 family metallopeptidase [Parasphingopyxis algicola]|uniref:M1 family metallopeptidase n=1 Tax=Parasphingopyxis algicola TaxID=2026624 RepID=UPI001FE46F38|nr:M1 family metallopeptidase [Parasphingopyxis algicola]